MVATLPGGQRAVAQRPGAQERGERLTRPRRSAGRKRPACSRCAVGGKPRALPRGIGGRSRVRAEESLPKMGGGRTFDFSLDVVKARLVEINFFWLVTVCRASTSEAFQEASASDVAIVCQGFHCAKAIKHGSGDGSIPGTPMCASQIPLVLSDRGKEGRRDSRGCARCCDALADGCMQILEGGHFALLGFGWLRATHGQIIVHHAPIVKGFLQQITEGGSKPSNAEVTGA